MFYTDTPSDFLRMGDIVEGYVLSVPKIKNPFNNFFVDYRVEVDIPKLLVVLTPCCSIGDKKISLAPLDEVKDRKSLFEVSYLKEDMTNLNRIMEPEKAFTPGSWSKKTPEEKDKIRNRPIDYQFEQLFIYEEHDLLPKYDVKLKGGDKFISGYYMIDFRKASRLECDCIISPNDEKNFTEEIRKKLLASKILELHRDTRQELRDKISNYYHRVPNEDKIE